MATKQTKPVATAAKKSTAKSKTTAPKKAQPKNNGFRLTRKSVAFILIAGIAVVGTVSIVKSRAATCTQLVFREGSRGYCVNNIQRMVNATTGTYIGVDGVYGPVTKSGVVKFQRNWGISADGVVGPQTWRSLCLASSRSKYSDKNITFYMSNAGCSNVKY